MKALLAFGVLALAGCAAGPDFEAPAPDLPAAWQDPALQGSDALPPAKWWRVFDDPVLDALEDEAAAASPDLQTAALRFAQGRVRRQMAAAQRGPQLDATAGASRQRQSEHGAGVRVIDAVAPANRDQLVELLAGPFDLFEAGFDASWELDLWGHVRRSIEAADADVATSRATFDGVRLALQADIARTYFELRAAQRELALARADLEAAGAHQQLLQARADGGLASGLDAARERAQFAGLQAQLPPFEVEQTNLMNQLALLLGEPPGALEARLAVPDAADREARELPDLSAGLPSVLARRRPDIRAAEARLHAATAGIGVAVAELYPRIVLGGDFGYEALDASDVGAWGSRRWSVGASLDLPLFDMGRRRSVVTLRKLQQQEAAVDYQRTVLAAWHEIDTVVASYHGEHASQGALTERVAAAREAWQLAQARQESGLISELQALEVRRALLAAQREQAASAGRLAVRYVMLCKALGGSESGDMN
ncbi:MAG: efflux transporter outer membrane subunit [Steroidobacteraceae bacterium]|nr:efflux transporter outer membrane subunit [Steroidobacteraceae bacterium]